MDHPGSVNAAACIRWAPECGRIDVGDFEGAILRRAVTAVRAEEDALYFYTNQPVERTKRSEQREIWPCC